MPPYLAGRTAELDEFRRLLTQRTILTNAILTGLRGVGKTVLLETFKPVAIASGWLWVGAELSESASVSEERLATRLLTDVAFVTSSLIVAESRQHPLGFGGEERIVKQPLSYELLVHMYQRTPGLASDKLKAVLEYVWSVLSEDAIAGIVFAFDEAQNLTDFARKDEYPLSLLLETFQSLQRKGLPMMLVLTGLPTLFPKLVAARTYSERMFHVMTLRQLDRASSLEAIVTPTARDDCPLKFSEATARQIAELSGGYPFFIQYVCREVFDVWLSKMHSGEVPSVPVGDIVRKLDNDFFQARWMNATDRQRELLTLIATLENCDDEFTVQDVVTASRELHRPFKPSNANLMLATLCNAGLVYKNRFGKYSLAVPLLSRFIHRQTMENLDLR